MSSQDGAASPRLVSPDCYRCNLKVPTHSSHAPTSLKQVLPGRLGAKWQWNKATQQGTAGSAGTRRQSPPLTTAFFLGFIKRKHASVLKHARVLRVLFWDQGVGTTLESSKQQRGGTGSPAGALGPTAICSEEKVQAMLCGDMATRGLGKCGAAYLLGVCV